MLAMDNRGAVRLLPGLTNQPYIPWGLSFFILDSRRVFGFDPRHLAVLGSDSKNTPQTQIWGHFKKGERELVLFSVFIKM